MKPSKNLLADDFVQGITKYADSLGDKNGIVITVKLDSAFLVDALVDTGATFCIFHPEDVEDLNVDFYDRKTRTIAGYVDKDGMIGRINITLVAINGNSVEVEATIWVPILHDGENWNVPNLLGYSGLLERIKFAVDPSDNSFYFGTV